MRQEVREILLDSAGASEALGQVFQHLKGQQKHLSYAYLARKMEMNSRSYISDLVNGKRPLTPKLAQKLMAALNLEPAAQEYFLALVELENTTDEEMKTFWTSELDKLRKLFSMHRMSSSEVKFSELFFCLEVFCSVSLFRKKCTVDDLIKYFGAERKQAVINAVHQLVAMEAVKVERGRVTQLKKFINIVEKDKTRDLINFLREGLKDTQLLLYKWFLRPKQAFFDSTVISVKRSHYQEILPHFKKEIQKLKAEFEEDSEADDLIRFNIQVYPIRHD